MAEHHPRRKDKEIADEEELRRILRQGKYATIGMASGDEPYVVSLSYGYDEARSRLYFHCAREGRKMEIAKRNPNVCATVIEDLGYIPGKCDHDYSSLVIRGTLRAVEGLEEKKRGMDVLLRHLEGDPDPIKARTLPGEARVRVLRRGLRCRRRRRWRPLPFLSS